MLENKCQNHIWVRLKVLELFKAVKTGTDLDVFGASFSAALKNSVAAMLRRDRPRLFVEVCPCFFVVASEVFFVQGFGGNSVPRLEQACVSTSPKDRAVRRAVKGDWVRGCLLKSFLKGSLNGDRPWFE